MRPHNESDTQNEPRPRAPQPGAEANAPRPRGKGRLVRVGTREVRAHGLRSHAWRDLFHHSMTAPWSLFFASFAAVFLTINTFYAKLYWLGDAPIANVRPGFEDLFYFSIETLATVGYGDMHPQTSYGHFIATIEIFTGMSVMAVMTGMVFARFSKPRARVLFANYPVIGPYEGREALMLRMANARHNMVAEATAKLWMTRVETSAEGQTMRRFHDLKLERAQNPVFALSWTIFHIIDETSPLHGQDASALAKAQASFVVTLSGLDETSGQTMYARHGYEHQALRWNHGFVDILGQDEHGMAIIDYGRFHDTQPRPDHGQTRRA